jgi:hypothetical protein
MHLHDTDMQFGQPISMVSPDADKIVDLTDVDGDKFVQYDDLVQKIIKTSEGSRGIGSFISLNFEFITRFRTLGNRGVRCYEGYAKDTKGRTWFLKIMDEFRAYDVGFEAEEHLDQLLKKYVTPNQE